MSNLEKWSTAAGSNNQASPDGFPENMAPSGVNDAAREVMAAVRRWYDDADWRNFDHTPSYATDASITISGDHTSVYHANRRVKITNSATTYYGTISSSSFSSVTRISVNLDSSASFTSSLGALYAGLTFTGDAIPRNLFQTAGASVINDLWDLSDVASSTPSDAQVLAWNSASAAWIPTTITSAITDINDLSDVSATAPTDGYLLGWSSSGASWIPTSPSSVPTNTYDLTDVSGTGSAGLYMAFTGGKWSPRSITIPADLNDLSDVSSSTPSTNQVLAWSGSVWAPATPTTYAVDLNDLSDVSSSAPSDGQVLAWSSSGASWQPTTTGGLNNIVEDSTPQLGGMLDVNGNVIGDGTRTLLSFVEDGSAVNFLQIENQATGAGPILRSTGSNTNVDMHLATKGSGSIVADADFQMGDNVLSGVELRDYGETTNSLGNVSGSQAINLASGAVVTGTLIASATFSISNVPPGGGASFTLILTNGGSATLNWPGSVAWTNGTAPTLTAAGVDVLTFVTPDTGTTWYGFLAGLDMS